MSTHVVELRVVVSSVEEAKRLADDMFVRYEFEGDSFPSISYCPTRRSVRDPRTLSISMHPEAVRIFEREVPQ